MIFINTAIKAFFKIILIIFLLSCLGLLICTGLAFQDDNTDKYNAAPSPQVLETVAKNAIFENETIITESEINGLFAYLIQRANNKFNISSDYKLLAAYLELNQASPCKIYIQASLKGRDVGFSADVNINLTEDHQLVFSLSNAKVGKLSIPQTLVTSILKKTSLENASKYISIDDLSVTLPAHYEYDIENLGTLVNVEVSSITVLDGEVHITTNPIVNDMLDNITGFFRDGLNNGIDYFKDKITGEYIEQ